jgi:N-acetylornithine carbamoyltransferase
MRHFLTTEDWTRTELEGLLAEAARLKKSRFGKTLEGKTIALVFFNPSLRTRTSFDVGIHQLGGHAIVLEPGKGAWPIAFEDGAIMDGDEEEHVREVAKVLSRYCDIVAVRAFPKFQDWNYDRQDKVLRSFAEHATVPVINLETITHPCQELALALTMQEKLGNLQGKNFLCTWTYHPKPLNTAVANSAILIASKLGMNVTLLCPTPEYALDPRYMQAAERFTRDAGTSFRMVHDIREAYAGAQMVYAKSWGALPYFGNWAPEKPIRDAHKHFIVDQEKLNMTNDAFFSHCLPIRRNVKVTDEVIDSKKSLVIDEAENRLHVQKAIMEHLTKAKR